MCFDTTASNTGCQVGACRLIEGRLLNYLFHLPCRHHILEIVAEKAFLAVNIETSSAPDIAIFTKFQEKWPQVDPNRFENASGHEEIGPFLKLDNVISFAERNLEFSQPRGDY